MPPRSLLALLLLPPLAATSAGAASLEEVEACVRANLPERSSQQTLELRSRDRTGVERVIAGELRWKRSEEGHQRLLLVLDAPPDVRGSAYLLRERASGKDVFVYLPELRKVRRIHPSSASGSLFGTDFSYEDLEHLQRLDWRSGSQRLPDAERDGRPAFVVETRPSSEVVSAYERIVTFVDRERCLPLRVEFYARGEQLAKLLRTDPDTIRREGRGWLAGSLVLEDLENETATRLLVKKIAIDTDIPDRVFTVTSLERGR